MLGILGMLAGLNRDMPKTQEITRIKYKDITTEIAEVDGKYEATIRREWRFTGFETRDEALEFCGRKVAVIDNMRSLSEVGEKVVDLAQEYGVNFEKFMEIAKQALEEKMGKPQPEMPRFLWTSEPENNGEQDTLSSSDSDTEASEGSSSEAS